MVDQSLIECHECRKTFTPKQWFQKYCTPRCRLLAFRKRNRPEGKEEE